MDRRHCWIVLIVGLSIAPIAGCRTGVRDFAELNDPAPFVRARAAGLDESVGDAQAIPALIAHLEDSDPVVRLSSHETLRQRTGQDFGFVPYGTPEDRAAAVARWRSWWATQSNAPSDRRRFPGTDRSSRP
ncbi:HEAT repeat domain-containing protein [Tautonia sp. JC769]|uniref:HEAT repeat domain-containing protein n=1 Tax=Tautonia sp. JC769 TaxID=3232135 RepID=UPI00345ABFE0